MLKRKAFILFVIVSLTVNCSNVFAAQNNINEGVKKAKIVKDYKDSYRYNWMDKVWVGLYPQNSTDITDVRPLEWLVLEKQEDRALLISRYVIDRLPYNLTREFCTWETSYIRNWLNNDFYNIAFDEDDKNCIIQTYNTTKDKRTGVVVNTVDKIFLLSDDEVVKYFNLKKTQYDWYDDNNRLESSYTEYAKSKGRMLANEYCEYFLRSTRFEIDDNLFCADTVGIDEYDDGNKSYIYMYPHSGGGDIDFESGVRPAMWVKYNPNAKTTMGNILDTADELGITNDVIKEGVKTATDFIPMPKPVGVIKDKVIDAVGDKVIDAVRGK